MNIKGPMGKPWPRYVQAIINAYDAEVASTGGHHVTLTINRMPKSLNHMYGRSAKNGKVQTWRKKGVDDFRDDLILNVRENGHLFAPKGACAALLLFESPLWVTKELQVRQMDADNRIKVVLDALETALDFPDELFWQVHVFKVASKRTRTTVMLYDLGDVVEYFY